MEAIQRIDPRLEAPRGTNTICYRHPYDNSPAAYYGHRRGMDNRQGTIVRAQYLEDDLVLSESSTGSIHTWRPSTGRTVRVLREDDDVLVLRGKSREQWMEETEMEGIAL